MAVRIYAFAKELGLDNQQLLDLCNKAGIKGKGSALASLEDDEVSAVKAFMSSGAVETATAEEEPAPLRPQAQSIDTRVPEIKSSAPVESVAEEPDEIVETEDVAEEETAANEAVEAAATEDVVEPTAEEVQEPEDPASPAVAEEDAATDGPPKKGMASKVGGLLERLRGATKKLSLIHI